MTFCPNSLMLLKEVPKDHKLTFISEKTGDVYDATPEQTLLAMGKIHESKTDEKYRNALLTTAFDPTNPRIRLDNGCTKCKRKVVSYQRLGDDQKVFYACTCSNIWTN